MLTRTFDVYVYFDYECIIPLMQIRKQRHGSLGFTIVELLVVIVVIGTLAAITIVAYTNISQKAQGATKQSDLSNGSTKLKMYQAEHGSYPTSLSSDDNGNYCPIPSDVKYCLKSSSGNGFGYLSDGNNQTFKLSSTGSAIRYYVANDTAPTLMTPDPTTIIIGTQVWKTTNLDVGTMINSTVDQTDNGSVQKYCYDDNPANCTTYGGLYLWNEMMQYSTTPGSQGICPNEFHVPTDHEWYILEHYLDSTVNDPNAISWRGTTVGTKLKPGGSSGFNELLNGYFNSDGDTFDIAGSYGLAWSSTQVDTNNTWGRNFYSGYSTVERSSGVKSDGISVRCMMY